MEKSREIRWFFNNNKAEINNWFLKNGKDVSTVRKRDDLYLLGIKRDDESIKLREGKFEIKQRTNKLGAYEFTHNIHGYLEDWIKWSFVLERQDSLAKNIDGNDNNWLKVQKKRIGIKLTRDSSNNIAMFDIGDILPYGVQIEYTVLLINNEEWFTFAAEWFGEQFLELDGKIMSEITGDTTLDLSNSCAYSTFLNQHYFNNKNFDVAWEK